MVNDVLFGESVKLSYSRFALLKCPVKYYITKFIGVQTYSIHMLLGIIVHKIYEDILTGKVTVEQAKQKETILSYIESVKDLTIPNINIDTEELISVISNHIWSDLLTLINHWISSENFELKVESEYTEQDFIITLLQNNLQTYIRPDIYLINEKQIKLIDIKTAKRYRPEFKDQLVFYLKILSEKYKNINSFVGYIYLSSYGELKQVLVYNREQLNTRFKQLLSVVERLYKELNIQTLKDIKKFVKEISKYDKNKLFKLRCCLYKHVGNVCTFCPIKDCCPINTLTHTPKYSKIISGETQGDLIVVTSYYLPKECEVLGFVDKS